MIKATIRDQRGPARLLHIESTGHGATEVCNAVSMLVQTLGKYACELASDHQDLLVEEAYASGQSDVRVYCCDSWDHKLCLKLDTVADFVVSGLRQLERQYPEHLELIEKCTF